MISLEGSDETDFVWSKCNLPDTFAVWSNMEYFSKAELSKIRRNCNQISFSDSDSTSDEIPKHVLAHTSKSKVSTVKSQQGNDKKNKKRKENATDSDNYKTNKRSSSERSSGQLGDAGIDDDMMKNSRESRVLKNKKALIEHGDTSHESQVKCVEDKTNIVNDITLITDAKSKKVSKITPNKRASQSLNTNQAIGDYSDVDKPSIQNISKLSSKRSSSLSESPISDDLSDEELFKQKSTKRISTKRLNKLLASYKDSSDGQKSKKRYSQNTSESKSPSGNKAVVTDDDSSDEKPRNKRTKNTSLTSQVSDENTIDGDSLNKQTTKNTSNKKSLSLVKSQVCDVNIKEHEPQNKQNTINSSVTKSSNFKKLQASDDYTSDDEPQNKQATKKVSVKKSSNCNKSQVSDNDIRNDEQQNKKVVKNTSIKRSPSLNKSQVCDDKTSDNEKRYKDTIKNTSIKQPTMYSKLQVSDDTSDDDVQNKQTSFKKHEESQNKLNTSKSFSKQSLSINKESNNDKSANNLSKNSTKISSMSLTKSPVNDHESSDDNAINISKLQSINSMHSLNKSLLSNDDSSDDEPQYSFQINNSASFVFNKSDSDSSESEQEVKNNSKLKESVKILPVKNAKSIIKADVQKPKEDRNSTESDDSELEFKTKKVTHIVDVEKHTSINESQSSSDFNDTENDVSDRCKISPNKSDKKQSSSNEINEMVRVQSNKHQMYSEMMDNFLNKNAVFAEIDIKSPVFTLNDLDSDDEVWLVQTPKHMHPKILLNQNLFKVKLEFESATYNSTVSNDSSDYISLLLPNDICNKRLATVPLQGTVRILEKPTKTVYADINKFEKRNVAFPSNLKVRHPIFGSDYEHKLLLPESIEEKLKVKVKRRLKHGKIKQEQPVKVVPSERKARKRHRESFPNESDFAEPFAKKPKHKKIKPENDISWTSEDAIASSLFEQSQKVKKHVKHSK